MNILKSNTKLTGNDKEILDREILYINYNRIRNLSLLIMVITLMILVFIDIPNLQKGYKIVGEGYRELFYLHIFLSISMLILFGLSWSKLRQSTKVTWWDKLLNLSFSYTLAVICALFSVNDQLINSQITLYILGLFMIAIGNYIKPVNSLFIYLSSYIIFIVGITKFQSNSVILQGHYGNSAILIIIAWSMSNILYNAKVEEIISRRTIEEANIELSETIYSLNESLLALDESQNMIFSLALAIESKDEYTHGHSERVVEYALALADYLGLSDKEKKSLWHAAILHDTGKIGIPDVILNKCTRLSEEEWQIMKSHPERGEKICSKLKFAQEILPVIRHHHEKYDGTGYPDGLKGENIPYLARIVAIADMVDAVTSQRPYRAAQTMDTALEELEKNAGIQFDPDLAIAFVNMHRGKKNVIRGI